jgi:hypothetical protein
VSQDFASFVDGGCCFAKSGFVMMAPQKMRSARDVCALAEFSG